MNKVDNDKEIEKDFVLQKPNNRISISNTFINKLQLLLDNDNAYFQVLGIRSLLQQAQLSI